MPAPAITLDEAACLDALRTFVVACVPEAAAVDVYRARPAASPGKWGLSVVLNPTTPLPVFQSPMGEESQGLQRQRVRVAVKTAAVGMWRLRVLGEEAVHEALLGATPATVVDGLLAALDLLGLPITVYDLTLPAIGFEVRADVAGASMGVLLTIPAGAGATATMVDDNIRAAVYNWGTWTIRAVVRDVASAGEMGAPSRAGSYAEMLRLRMQAQSVPVTAGLAYPYQRDLLAAANLRWRQTLGPFDAPVVDGGVWHRGVALDFAFDVSSALLVDVPSLDVAVVSAPVLADT